MFYNSSKNSTKKLKYAYFTAEKPKRHLSNFFFLILTCHTNFSSVACQRTRYAASSHLFYSILLLDKMIFSTINSYLDKLYMFHSDVYVDYVKCS